MREEQKLNNALERDGINTQTEILNELKLRYPQYVKQSDIKSNKNTKRKVAIISSLAAVAASVAIIVPCAVLLPNKGGSGNNNVNNDYYCEQGEYSLGDFEYTLREYNENCGGNILYFDWYDIAEAYQTDCYVRNADNEILCIEEWMFLAESDELIYLSVTKSNVYLSMFDYTIKHCNKEQSVDNHTVKWTIDTSNALCIFEDHGYRYFIQISQGQDENRLFKLVSELLKKN